MKGSLLYRDLLLCCREQKSNHLHRVYFSTPGGGGAQGRVSGSSHVEMGQERFTRKNETFKGATHSSTSHS